MKHKCLNNKKSYWALTIKVKINYKLYEDAHNILPNKGLVNTFMMYTNIKT